ncbi:LEAF RUST 10 DISEASE-RESISTANCE LOCUS RECEPTOR-LIKE PROTEIN KINASE-like 1.3 isoform X4 [Capsicum annuum]|uniref:LEAF RUST 10 DISEASE-RESISTANCE LOCUS RECEPTOR-LIKE PROTEIN KINASE-like 1.3 isoform X4 n=1 Tax=Capsicum annuum TaxID=4072 RepID=UPI001FB06414|nr:LEAF RUST 10 DISEASE-RESISTANCE LOCUS RECEPTOR-LIKE PROTEIN KINASE-like 1.3 isoform X4 [Capsicum annuum]
MDPFYASVREMRASMVSVEVIRRNFAEWDVSPYQYQKSNMDESENWCHPFWTANHANGFRKSFTETCKRYESFDFSIEPVVDGRLFRGTIVEGSVSRPAIVKTWDYLLPMELENGPRLYKFCDEIELLTNERANKHPNLVKFYKCCFDRRLAVVYDAEFTRVLSDVLLDDDFGWDKRIKVAIQLADLLSWLHKNGIAVGSVTIECIMIDDEVNIKVFDFGYVSNHVNEDTTISALVRVGQEAPEIFSGMYADDEI